ncbi:MULTISPECIES: 50S ribosomal protein L25/general stress protein Ctc [Halomonadaceae]|jgi:large subunit ribosomal protein L25|uniref:50S ribosomal protein L25/general stress protein Ctc n=1 Tax=Halomonadaceae TaxID=28256 RepID=UPI001581763A|nr:MULTISPECIES: 50S ribosomal protein L25/general stress protein Ctc [Halomonas]MDI4637765.1 50S ribosomal protein L25/general stress protein Ctc [Halomonas sp. BMC7]NUJ58784.1 50S ribosomal protein L25/general stress protein Ctc [Halomonas taeanensis]|tara:strand:- start:658 stop:1320 length:663 start_codon:yes stop_codon:yes gene_type:complete
MSDFNLNASVRHDLGKGASRRLRRADLAIPAIIYGGETAPKSIAIDKAPFYKAIEDESFFSSVITLDVEGQKEQVVVRDLQRHPFKPLVTHADFLRVDATHELTLHVPLHVVGEDTSKAIKDEDGELHQLASDVEISCLPKDLPEYLEVDISNLELGTTLHLSDLTVPAGVTLVALTHGEDHDNAVLSVTKAKVRDEESEEGEEAETPAEKPAEGEGDTE